MKRIMLVLALMAMGLPATADEVICTTVELDSNQITDVNYQDGGPRWHIIGPYLWFSWATADALDDAITNRTEYPDTLSFDITGAIKAVGCSDGSVTITEAPAPVQETAPKPSPEPTVGSQRAESLSHYCTREFADVLTRYCGLPNQVLLVE